MAPWGAATFWTAETMKSLSVPMFLIAGDYDDVAGYENGIRLFFDWALNSDRYLGLNEKVPGTGKRIETKLGITQKMDQNRAFFSSCRTTEKNKMNIAA